MDEITVETKGVVLNHDLPALIEAAMRNGDLAIEVYAVSPSGVAVPVGDVIKIDWPVVVRPVDVKKTDWPVVKGSADGEGVKVIPQEQKPE